MSDDKSAGERKLSLRERHKMTKPKRLRRKVPIKWSLKEKAKLVRALRLYGFASPEKLASVVGTQEADKLKAYVMNEMQFIKEDYDRAMKEHSATTAVGRNKETEPSVGSSMVVEEEEEKSLLKHKKVSELLSYPCLEQWKQVASHVTTARKNDFQDDFHYSEVLSDLFRKFGEEVDKELDEELEEEDCSSPDTPDFKALYHSFECMLAGRAAPMLRPIDSMLMCQLVADLTVVARTGAQEEKKYMKNYKGPVKFMPVPTIIPSSNYSDSLDAASEALPETMPKTMEEVSPPEVVVEDTELYENFQQYLKICEDLNPLGIPASLIEQRQEKLAKLIKTGSF